MADPVVDNADHAVDELKRKARRRLVGAVVLALAAATILPMLLEQEQKPLGDDVSVQIPPVDGDKFVPRLKPGEAGGGAGDATVRGGAITTAPGKAAPAPASGSPAPVTSSAATPANPAPAAAAAPAAPQAATPKAASAESKPAGGTPASASEAKTAKASEATKPAKASEAKAPAAAANPALSSAATLASSAPQAAATAPEAATAEGFVVQLGAFTDKYGANALARRLKAAGYPAYTEPVETSRGTLWRVRVGGYPTRSAAVDARGRLKADGHDGVVTAAK